MQIAAMYNLNFFFSFGVNSTAPMSIRSSSLGRNLIHFIAMYWSGPDIREFWRRHLSDRLTPQYSDWSTKQMDPDALDDEGLSPMELLERRMLSSDETRPAGMLRPTRADVYEFASFVADAQWERWARCCDQPGVLEGKQRVLDDGSTRKIRLWLERHSDYEWPGRWDLKGQTKWPRPRDGGFLDPDLDPALCEKARFWDPTDFWWRDIDDDDSGLAGVIIPDETYEFC